MSIQAASAGRAGWVEARALAPTALYWAAMFAASAVGTNLGDFWADFTGLGLAAASAPLALAALALMIADRRLQGRTEACFWLALVVLRAMATNIGDFLYDDLYVARPVSSLVFALATLAAGAMTSKGRSPRIDSRYWAAMALGGVFGTVFGDLVSHAVGLAAATVLLGGLIVAAIFARSFAAATAALGYWAIVLAERAAGTAAGDWLAEERGLGLGLPLAMAIYLAALVAVLTLRSRFASITETASGGRGRER